MAQRKKPVYDAPATRRRSAPAVVVHDEQKLGLRFDRRISLDTIIQIVGIAIVLGGPFIVWGRAMESRVLTLEGSIVNSEKRDGQREEYAKEQRAQMFERLTKVDGSLQALQVTVAEIRAQLSVRNNNGQGTNR